MLNSLSSRFQNFVNKEFGRKEGKDFLAGARVADGDSQAVDIRRVGTLAGVGAGGGALLGGAVGGLAAVRAISQVPEQSLNVDFRQPSLRSEELGKIPRDNYTPTPGWRNGMGLRWSWPSRDSGVPTVPVHRDNPEYYTDGTPRTLPTSETFTGRGTPSVSWQTKDIRHHTMEGYQRSVDPDIAQVFDHTETWTESESYTVYDSQSESYQNCTSQYNSDGSTGQDCYTDYRTVSVPRTEYRDVQRSRDVYRDELRGYNERYSPNISSRVVGTYEMPRVSFDHGVDTASFVLKGVLIGAGIGALALGVAGALEDKYFPGVLPGHKDKDGGSTPPSMPTPTPVPPSAPEPRPVPQPDYGQVSNHAHEGRRHTHAGGERWHFHGCPDEGHDALDTSTICFKPGNVPSGYLSEASVPCESNGSVCYVQKGAGATA